MDSASLKDTDTVSKAGIKLLVLVLGQVLTNCLQLGNPAKADKIVLLSKYKASRGILRAPLYLASE